jgi:hypothetical protein
MTRYGTVFARVVMLLAFASVAFTQVGGNDWRPLTGQSWTTTDKDGASHTRTLYYSPSTVSRSGDVVTLVLDTVYNDGKPTEFFQVQLNCRTHQHTFARYDISTKPPTLEQVSAWTNNEPNSPAPASEAVVCR